MDAEQFREEISTVAAAEKYQLTPSYVARLARTHVIHARKFGRDWIIDENALRDYLAQPRKPGPKPQGTRKQSETDNAHALLDAEPEGELHAAIKERGDNKAVP